MTEKLVQSALHRKQIKSGILTEKESKRLMEEANKRDSLEDEVKCERCGEETAVRFVGDESYDYCSDCNQDTHK